MILPVTLRPNRMKLALQFLAGALFTAGSIYLIRHGEPLTGWTGAGFGAACLLVFALQFHPAAAFLRLLTDGFVFCSLFRRHFVPWEDVQEFTAPGGILHGKVAWNFSPGYPDWSRLLGINARLSGYDAALPDTYGMKPQDLADVLNGLRQRHSADIQAA